jgi:hypothetical protein
VLSEILLCLKSPKINITLQKCVILDSSVFKKNPKINIILQKSVILHSSVFKKSPKINILVFSAGNGKEDKVKALLPDTWMIRQL